MVTDKREFTGNVDKFVNFTDKITKGYHSVSCQNGHEIRIALEKAKSFGHTGKVYISGNIRRKRGTVTKVQNFDKFMNRPITCFDI